MMRAPESVTTQLESAAEPGWPRGKHQVLFAIAALIFLFPATYHPGQPTWAVGSIAWLIIGAEGLAWLSFLIGAVSISHQLLAGRIAPNRTVIKTGCLLGLKLVAFMAIPATIIVVISAYTVQDLMLVVIGEMAPLFTNLPLTMAVLAAGLVLVFPVNLPRMNCIVDAVLISVLCQFLLLTSSAKFLDGGVMFANLQVAVPVWNALLLGLLLVPAINRHRTICCGLAVGGMVLCIAVAGSNPLGVGKSRIAAAAGDIGAFNSALALHHIDVHSKQYPITTLMQLFSDTAAGWAGPYMATIANDPWNNRYVYTSNGAAYTIQSVHRARMHQAETIRYVFTGADTTSIIEYIP